MQYSKVIRSFACTDQETSGIDGVRTVESESLNWLNENGNRGRAVAPRPPQCGQIVKESFTFCTLFARTPLNSKGRYGRIRADVSLELAGVVSMRGMFFALSDGSYPVTYALERI